VRALDRKLLRDLWQMKSQAAAILLIVAAGAATFLAMQSTHGSLSRSLTTYYERSRFAQVWDGVERAPDAMAERVAAIPGVAAVATRVVTDVVLDVRGMSEPAVGRLISIPDRQDATLSELYLRRGRWIEANRPDEVLVSEAFALAHRLGPGDTVDAIINGRRRHLAIVGVALSPEWVYQLRGGELLPDDKRFGVFWMGRAELAAAMDRREAWNEIAVTLVRGASEGEVIKRMDSLLATYGGRGAYGRDRQLSNRFLMDELDQLRTQALVTPAIMLAIAAFLLNVVLVRLVSTQRTQIAVLKAFGYSIGSVTSHYLGMLVLIVLGGLVVGIVVGVWLGRGLTTVYAHFYHFPEFQFRLSLPQIFAAAGACLGAALIGGAGGVRRVAILPPAEAMQPEPPPTFRATLIERMGLHRLLSPAARMILRNLERRPIKALISIVAIAFGVSAMVIGGAQSSAVDAMITTQFSEVQREDLTVTFVRTQRSDATSEVAHLPGVQRVEPFRAAAATVRVGHRKREVAVMGLERASDLRRAVDANGRALILPEQGVLVTRRLAEVLHLSRGDSIRLEFLEGRRPIRTVRVVGEIDELLGLAVYADFDMLGQLLGEPGSSSGAFVAVTPGREDELYSRLKRMPGVASVGVRRAALATMRKLMEQNLGVMRIAVVTAAVIIAFGVVYNAARIALAERSRELATLRVIGMTRAEISRILLGELAVLVLAALPLGLFLGWVEWSLAVRAYSSELIRIPSFIGRASYAWAVIVVVAAASASALVVRRRLDRLDLVGVLKTRE
jgi:putative ABC transport system permease protein